MYLKHIVRVFLLLLLVSTNLLSSNKDEIKSYLIDKKAYNSYIWKALLHINNNKPSIDNETFLLSYNKFTLKNELLKTVDIFYDDKKSICKYPARYLWIEKTISDVRLKLPTTKCDDFEEYKKRLNPKKIKLVFVSEDITNPSSMMGHTFFKVESYPDDNNYTKTNAVSYYTIIDTANPAKLLIKSLITGMKGYFLLSPYQKKIDTYLFKEKRNIWEYDLVLTEYQKNLIYYHFWELKTIETKYLFTSFNCATIINDMLSITQKDYKKDTLWVTPKDVVKNGYKKGIISSSKLIPSYEWEIKMLIDSIDTTISDNIIDILNNKNYTKIKKFNFSTNKYNRYLEKKLFLTYALYLYYDKRYISTKELKTISKLVNLQKQYSINLNNYKNPVNTQAESQFQITVDNKNNTRLSLLAASNTLYDYNKEYFIESSLEIGKLTLLNNKNNTKIEEFDFFNSKALIPYDKITKSYSKELKIDYEQHYDKNLDPYGTYNISGGIGLTKQIKTDIFLYSFLNVGVGYGNNLYLYSYPQIGVIVYEIFNMKSVIEYDYIYNQNKSYEKYTNFNFTQSYFISKRYNIEFNINQKENNHKKITTYRFGFKYIF